MYKSENLDELRKNNPNYLSKKPFEHQKDAFIKLSNLYDLIDFKSGILVLPTGAGKTFTSINWICRNIIAKDIKVLWLAHTSHLLEQAYHEFCNNFLDIPPQKQIINIRVVSSNPKHSNPSEIKNTDDVLIITSQTAISNYNSNATDIYGKKITTQFEIFLFNSNDKGLFVVLDEAHHAPAYGVRNLLIGGSKFKKGIMQIVPNCNFLGLTATPTYSEPNRRGWLWEIFKDGIIYQADKTELEKQGILAIPNYIDYNTEIQFDLDQKSYQQIVREHKDLPENIIDNLAKNEQRNNFIAEIFIKNRKTFGKTFIFADRWYQCVYIKEKFKKARIKADAVFSRIDAKLTTVEERNSNIKTDNDEILNKFKQNQLEVLLNVQMLTEGTDVPDVDTVFITRQTTSSILLTQMIGRALRGTQAQKNGKIKNTANIVYFIDNWRQVINFASATEGGLAETEKVKGYYPIEYVSIKLIEELSRRIDSGTVLADIPFIQLLPYGWYETEITVTKDDETQNFKEFVIVFESNKVKFEKFINDIQKSLPSEWEDENLSEDYMSKQIKQWVYKYFSKEDNLKNTLDYDLSIIARHIAQNEKKPPKIVLFKDRNTHDLYKIAYETVEKRMDELSIYDMLESTYNDSEKLWKAFYKSFDRFQSAFDFEKRCAVYKIKYGNTPIIKIADPDIIKPTREPTEEEKEKIFKHDNYTCQCCGKYINPNSKKERRLLVIDHVSAYKFRGDSSDTNLQTLCVTCNTHKNINEINFRVTCSKLLNPKDFEAFNVDQNEDFGTVLKRIINFFYNCKAVLNINWSTDGRNKYSKIWEIELYPENKIEWLKQNKQKLMNFIRNELEYKQLENIIIK